MWLNNDAERQTWAGYCAFLLVHKEISGLRAQRGIDFAALHGSTMTSLCFDLSLAQFDYLEGLQNIK